MCRTKLVPPLTVLMGFVETLQTLQLAAQERARYLDLMAQQATRMHSVVQDLLTLSRLEGSPFCTWDARVASCADLVAALRGGGAGALFEPVDTRPSAPHEWEFPEPVAAPAAGDIAGA